MAYDSEVWKCHPDLMAEWEQFVNDSRRAVGNDLHSDLWMNFWRSEVKLVFPIATVMTALTPKVTP